MIFTNAITLSAVDLFPIRAEGGVSPNMALGAMLTRPALLVRLVDSDGCYGWGEVWANFPPRANVHKANLIEDVVTPQLLGLCFKEPREIEHQLRHRLGVYFLHVGQQQVFEHILAGLDTALWDLALRKAGKTFAQFMELPDAAAASYASSINTNDLEHLVPLHAGLGQTHFKIKIGFLCEEDYELVERAFELFPENSHLMVDSNQVWDLSRAKEALASLEAFSPLFAEEALPANAPLLDWGELASSTSIPLAGGENIYGIEHFLAMANVGMKVLQPDVSKWGGVTGALDLAAALPSDTLLWPHYMGTAVGQMAALSVSTAINAANGSELNGESVCELDVNENPLRTDLCGDVMRIQNGCVPLNPLPGLVSEPLSHCLAEYSSGVGSA